LREGLRVVQGVAATAHKMVKRRPIRLAKLGQRGFGNLRRCLALAGGENKTPLRRSERIALATLTAWQNLHCIGLAERLARGKARKSAILCSTAQKILLKRERQQQQPTLERQQR
jgi:hypothetical protein